MTYVLYHDNCVDGFASAFAFWLFHHEEAHYIPVQYGQPFPSLLEGSCIYIVDFSYSAEILKNVAAFSQYVVVLDHHKTAKNELEGLIVPNLSIKFDMNRSGCILSWIHLYGEETIPDLFRYIEDRDLWNWKLPDSRAVNAVIRNVESSFEAYDILFRTPLLKLIDKGYTILETEERLITLACKNVFFRTIDGHEVPTVNSCLLQSEIGERLYKSHPDKPFAAICYEVADKIIFSLRSQGDFDVSEVAKKYGGGGHKNAAGFSIGVKE